MTRHLLPILVLASATIAASSQPQPARYYNPRFSADAARVIFESTREGRMAVYSINVDGTSVRKLTDGLQDDAQPQWSQDGSLITFTSNGTPGSLNKVFVMRADGSNRKQISTGSKNDAAPSFSTDGRSLAWAATTELPENWRDIGVASADGTGAPRLITSGTGNDQAPVCFSMNADGTDPRRVADFVGSISSDGRLVTYSKVVDGRSGIFVRPLTGGAEREIVGG